VDRLIGSVSFEVFGRECGCGVCVNSGDVQLSLFVGYVLACVRRCSPKRLWLPGYCTSLSLSVVFTVYLCQTYDLILMKFCEFWWSAGSFGGLWIIISGSLPLMDRVLIDILWCVLTNCERILMRFYTGWGMVSKDQPLTCWWQFDSWSRSRVAESTLCLKKRATCFIVHIFAKY